MSKITIIVIGKTSKEFIEPEKHYLKLINSNISIIYLDGFTHLPIDKQIEHTSDQIIKEIEKIKDYKLITLDVKGKNYSSEEFCDFLKHTSSLTKNIIFVIGGSHGLSEKLLKKSDYKISFSKMTFPHQLAKIILLEQIYRSEAIISGKKYHK